MPNPPIPTALKVLNGNPGRRPLNADEPKPKTGIPKMPKWLKAYPIAVKEWKRETKILDDAGIMTLAEEGNLAMRCFLAQKIQDMANDDSSLGHLKNLITEYRQLGAGLGLDPTTRTRLRGGKKAEKSKVEAFMEAKRVKA